MPLNFIMTTNDEATLGLWPSFRLPLTPSTGLRKVQTYQTFLYKGPSQQLITRLGPRQAHSRDSLCPQRPSHQQ